MAKEKQKDKVREAVIKILGDNSGGLRHGELVEGVEELLDGVPHGTVIGNLRQMTVNNDDPEVYKPDRGFYRLRAVDEEDVDKEIAQVIADKKVSEEAFYQPFAEWLRDELNECTEAIELGRQQRRQEMGNTGRCRCEPPV